MDAVSILLPADRLAEPPPDKWGLGNMGTCWINNASMILGPASPPIRDRTGKIVALETESVTMSRLP